LAAFQVAHSVMMIRKIFNRRNVVIGAITLCSLLILASLLTLFLVRSGRLDRWLAARLQVALAEYGVRAAQSQALPPRLL
jgi:hypothetical protein